MSSRSVFLDRDGTINREVHRLRHESELELLEGAADAIRLLNESDFRVVIVTNQAAIGRGILSEDGLQRIHEKLHRLLITRHARVDAVYHCPHHPSEAIGRWKVQCGCRKPEPGMLLNAARDLDLDLATSWMVGDKISDVQAGFAAGCRGVLVRTGYGKEAEAELEKQTIQPHYIANDILEAVKWIVRQTT